MWLYASKASFSREHQNIHTGPLRDLRLHKTQLWVICGNLNFLCESTNVSFLYMDTLERIIRFSSYFILFHYFPHFLNSCNQSTILLNLFVLFLSSSIAEGVFFTLRDFHTFFFSMRRIYWFFFFLTGSLRALCQDCCWAQLNLSSLTHYQRMAFLLTFLLLTFGYIWKGKSVHNAFFALFSN